MQYISGGSPPPGRGARRPEKRIVAETTPSTAGFEVRSEARGPRWIAWLTRGGDEKPVRSVVVVGATRQEAEARAREWAREASARGHL